MHDITRSRELSLKRPPPTSNPTGSLERNTITPSRQTSFISHTRSPIPLNQPP
ncbi:hypothetical protein GQ44DRAFT_698086 [Phaeosphaeriaceae sp. PMI808]|nr:hypothetical protein GQ44DRAFT_698086 [Phaeosphaeriaceae sp. PMI808]